MFHTIKAKNLEEWSDILSARKLLPVLIRKLICETVPSNSITQMDFPGYENIQKHGHDGILVSDVGSQFISKGKSVWELGTNEDISAKANSDFKKRACQANKDTSFVFVSSRNWTNKDKWLKGKNGWRDVRAFDANDLEQWLERAPYTSVWLSEKMETPPNYLTSPEKFLNDWLADTKPKFTDELLLSNRAFAQDSLIEFLKNKQLSSIFTILADTRNEATAFVSAVIKRDFSDIPAMILKNNEACNEAPHCKAIYNNPSILIAHSKEVARNVPTELLEANMVIISEVGEIHEKSLTSREINTENSYSTHSVILPRPQREDFYQIFGRNYNESNRLYIQTGGSISALHRVLNKNLANRDPEWAKINKNDKNAIWLSLLGCWDELYEGDRKIICDIANIAGYNIWDVFINSLKEAEETPLEMTIGDKRGYRLFSRVDAFSAISSKIHADDIDRFLVIAEKVLGDEDSNYPCASDNDSKPYFKQNRYYSDLLRKGIGDGLIILNLYKDMLICGDITDRITSFYSKIFVSDRSWYFLLDVLPKLAEASPNDFIKNLKQTLNTYPERLEICFTPKRKILMFADHQHHNLLLALELLAWNNERLGVVLKLLCQLQEKFEDKININYDIRPSESLKTILSSWLPQTAANVEQRKKAIENLYTDYAYQTTMLALSLSHKGDRMGKPSHIPIWREDALNIKPVSPEDKLSIIIKYKEIVTRFIGDKNQNLLNRLTVAEKTLDNFDYWEDEFVIKVTNSILNLPNNNQEMTESIRNHAKAIQSEICLMSDTDEKKYDNSAILLLENIYDHFSGQDIISKYTNLFSYLPKARLDNDSEYQKKIEEHESNQIKIIIDIYNDKNIEGLIALINLSDDSRIISKNIFIAFIDHDEFELTAYLVKLLNSNVNRNTLKQHLNYIFGWTIGHKTVPDALDAGKVIEIINKVITELENSKNNDELLEKKITLLHALRIDQKEGRDYIDNLSALLNKQYFNTLRIPHPLDSWNQRKNDEHYQEDNWLVDGFIKHKRPRLGWHSFESLSYISPEKQLYLLDAMFINGSDEGGGNDPFPKAYDIERILEKGAIQVLDNDAEDRYFRIEFKFYKFIEYKFRVIENSFVERIMGKKPEFFVKLHKHLYKNDDGKVVLPDDFDEKMANAFRDTARDVLYNLNLCSINFSWHLDNENLDKLVFYNWILKVRKLAKEAKMTKAIDDSIGQGLGRGACLSIDFRPKLVICSILEHIQNKKVFDGYRNARINARSITHNGVDDHNFTSEDLANKYDKLSDNMCDDFPFVANIMSSLGSYYRSDFEAEKANTDRQDLYGY